MGVSHQEAVFMSGDIIEKLSKELGGGALACYPVVADQEHRDDDGHMVVRVEVDDLEAACVAHDVVNNMGYADDVMVAVPGHNADEPHAGGQPIYGEAGFEVRTAAAAAVHAMHSNL